MRSPRWRASGRRCNFLIAAPIPKSSRRCGMGDNFSPLLAGARASRPRIIAVKSGQIATPLISLVLGGAATDRSHAALPSVRPCLRVQPPRYVGGAVRIAGLTRLEIPTYFFLFSVRPFIPA